MRVLHLLSQRPSLTGSGITLDAMVRFAAQSRWEQQVVVGVPVTDSCRTIGGLEPERIHPLFFGADDLPFPVPGMSDVMPYPSTVFSAMDDSTVSVYLSAWRKHLSAVIDGFRPDIIHSHHVWLMSSMLKDLAPATPVVTHCHATGLRQMKLAPHLADRVRTGCARNDAFVALHRGHARELVDKLKIDRSRVHVVGAGYRDDLFHPAVHDPGRQPSLLYIGKYAAAKGLPQLLEAVERIATRRPDVVLHVAGDGSGVEAESLRSAMAAMAPRVVLHGQLDQADLADLMRRSTVCVLPSYYEGLPLVLVEALACGCRLVATALPGIADELAPKLGDALELVDPPSMASVDTPAPDSVPEFVDRLAGAVDRALDAPPVGEKSDILQTFTWRAVFLRIEDVWRRLIEGNRY
jgi:glycosyltransferase involved in cell wall biosynthesis